MDDIIINIISRLCPNLALKPRCVCRKFRARIPMLREYKDALARYMDILDWKNEVIRLGYDDEPVFKVHYVIGGVVYPDDDPAGQQETLRRGRWLAEFLPEFPRGNWWNLRINKQGKEMEMDIEWPCYRRPLEPRIIHPPSSPCRLDCDNTLCYCTVRWSFSTDYARKVHYLNVIKPAVYL